jgi:hypothetical protein
MYIRKPLPIAATAMGTVCPVCGHTSYSRGGVHPQCSALLVDRPLLAERRRDRALERPVKRKP